MPINTGLPAFRFMDFPSVRQTDARYYMIFPALKCVGVNNVSRVGICCFLYYKELLICNIVVYYLIVFIVK